MEPRRILIVANQTAAGEPVKRLIRHRIEEGPCTFTLLVPASPPHGTATWTEGRAHALAEQRMHEALDEHRAMGANIEGVVGDTNPMLAIDDLLMHRDFDEIVISTLPRAASRWLRQDIVRRVQRRYDVSVTHVVEARAPAKVS